MTLFMIFIFGTVVWLSKGAYDPSVPLLVVLFLCWCFLSVFRPRSSRHFPTASRFSPVLHSVMIGIKPNLMYVVDSLRDVFSLYRVLPMVFVFLPRWIPALSFLIFYLAVIPLSPHPHIDVFSSNTLAVDFFLKGINPYSQTYPDIYHGEFDYTPGFLYWPGALYLQTASRSLFGDIRVLTILAWWIAPFLFQRNHMRSKDLSRIWWSLPFVAFGLEQAWLDPILSLSAALVLLLIRKKKWILVGIAIGFASSVKQYGFLIGLFPVLQLALDHHGSALRKTVLASLTSLLILLAPFAIWNLQDFLTMTVFTHTHAMARPDALNFTAFWIKMTGTEFPAVAQLFFSMSGFLLAGIHLILNRKSRGLAVIPECWAISFGFSMLFGKFAFCNYHWLLISFWLLALSCEDDGTAQA